MARWDVQVLGLDEGKPARTVIAAAARRLGAEEGQVERLVAHAPTTLVAELEEDAAKALVLELRAIGLRVKPRPNVAQTVPAGPPMHMTPPRTSLPVTDERATAPTMSILVPDTRDHAIESFAAPSAGVARDPSRSTLEQLHETDTSGTSGLVFEDVPVRAPPPKAAPASIRPAPATATPTPIAASEPEPEDERPRTFWAALPGAFLVPLRGPVLPGLVVAPICMGAAVLCTILGTFTAIVGVLVMSAAYIGVTLQVAHRCLWATAVGERMPASLPTDFLSEYAFPGIGVVVVQGIFGGMLAWGAGQALSHGVPTIVLQALGVFFALYNVIGFTLAAASRSAVGFLDVAKILRILMLAPLEVAAIALIGAIVQGGAIAIASAQILAALAAGGIGATLLALTGSIAVIALAGTYGSALSATMMGMLFWARPKVAG